MKILPLDAAAAARRRGALMRLLRDAIEHGASIGFTLPVKNAELSSYWRSVRHDLAFGRRILLAAIDARGRMVGAVQLGLETRSNGRHRAEVQKLMVLHAARGRGLGARLMARIEAVARSHRRSLLFLDTSVGRGGAVAFYRRLGWKRCGGIPDYAADPDGSLHANAFFYKRVGRTEKVLARP